jgi:PPM family protein phosphatase
MINACGATDPGLVRENNEDSIYMNQEAGLFIVADGMGGHDMGEFASATATKVIAGSILGNFLQTVKDDEAILDILRNALKMANDEIYRYSQELSGRCIIGTTVSVALFVKNKLFIAHIGDSRIYLQRSGVLQQLTNDHNHAQELVDAGLLTADEAANHPQSHMLTRAIGVANDIIPDLSMHEVKCGDRFLLTTDGLLRVVTEKNAMKFLKARRDLNTKCKDLLTKALEKGAPDNVSIIIAETPAKKCFFSRIFSRE